MQKSILAVIVGYIGMAIAGFALLSAACWGLGIAQVFQPQSYVVTPLWLVITAVVTLVSGILGGWLCLVLSKSKGACLVLAGVVFALGMFFAIPHAMRVYPPAVRLDDVTVIQAMLVARTPPWMLLLKPVLGTIGVLLGARKKGLPAG